VASSRARSSDIKLIAGATVAVILAGLFIAGGILVATSGGSKNPICGQLNVGKATDVRDRLDTQGAGFYTGGASCGFWLALTDGNIVAYRVRQPSGCALNLRDSGRRWVCGSDTLSPGQLAQYPVSIQRVGAVDAVVVDLGPTAPASTTTTTTIG